MELALVVENLSKKFVSMEYRDFSIPMNYIPFLYFYYKIAEKRGRIQRREVYAIANVSFEAAKGECLGVLGPNGSGKTTLLRILAGLTNPSGGRIVMMGEDVTRKPDARASLTMYVPGLSAASMFLSPHLSVKENLIRFANYARIPREKVDEAMKMARLEEVRNKVVYELSSGWLARVMIALGLLRDAEIYLFDETFLGISFESFLDIIGFLKSEVIGKLGKTLILATNNLRDAMALCNRFIFLMEGRVVAAGSVDNLAREYGLRRELVLRVSCQASREQVRKALSEVGELLKVVDSEEGAEEYRILIGEDARVSEILRLVEEHSCQVVSLQIREPSLEDVYLAVYRGWMEPRMKPSEGCYVVM